MDWLKIIDRLNWNNDEDDIILAKDELKNIPMLLEEKKYNTYCKTQVSMSLVFMRHRAKNLRIVSLV